jgi:hypothetical protein
MLLTEQNLNQLLGRSWSRELRYVGLYRLVRAEGGVELDRLADFVGMAEAEAAENKARNLALLPIVTPRPLDGEPDEALADAMGFGHRSGIFGTPTE